MPGVLNEQLQNGLCMQFLGWDQVSRNHVSQFPANYTGNQIVSHEFLYNVTNQTIYNENGVQVNSAQAAKGPNCSNWLSVESPAMFNSCGSFSSCCICVQNRQSHAKLSRNLHKSECKHMCRSAHSVCAVAQVWSNPAFHYDTPGPVSLKLRWHNLTVTYSGIEPSKQSYSEDVCHLRYMVQTYYSCTSAYFAQVCGCPLTPTVPVTTQLTTSTTTLKLLGVF